MRVSLSYLCRFTPGVLLVFLPQAWTRQDLSPLEKYRTLEFPARIENYRSDDDPGWKDRVAAEFDVINSADLGSLRAALKDSKPFVRALAARALGIRGDKTSADSLAELCRIDPAPGVRLRAVQALGYLKTKPEAIELAKKDPLLEWTAIMAAGQLGKDTDYAALVREAYAAGIQKEAMGSAKVGEPAPDFAALTSDGNVFKLSEVLGKKPVAIYFAFEDT